MINKFIKITLLAFFVSAIAFAAATFLAEDLAAEIVYHQKHIRTDDDKRPIGIECYGPGKGCRIKVFGGKAILLPAN